MCVEILDWIVAMDLQHYKTEKMPDYEPSGVSHWYIKRSPERFTCEELIEIYNGTAKTDVINRWNWALTDIKR
jgi:hypothetical protein